MLKTLVYGLLVILVVIFDETTLVSNNYRSNHNISGCSIFNINYLSRFVTNMRRNDRNYSVINQTSKNQKYNNIKMDDNTSAIQIKKPKLW